MEDDEKIDLSALDPSRDGARWERMVQHVADRAVAPRPPAVVIDLYRHARPLLAAAAAIAALAWLPALASDGQRGQAATSAATSDSIATLAEWAERGEAPASADLLTTLGGSDAAR